MESVFHITWSRRWGCSWRKGHRLKQMQKFHSNGFITYPDFSRPFRVVHLLSSHSSALIEPLRRATEERLIRGCWCEKKSDKTAKQFEFIGICFAIWLDGHWIVIVNDQMISAIWCNGQLSTGRPIPERAEGHWWTHCGSICSPEESLLTLPDHEDDEERSLTAEICWKKKDTCIVYKYFAVPCKKEELLQQVGGYFRAREASLLKKRVQ